MERTRAQPPSLARNLHVVAALLSASLLAACEREITPPRPELRQPTPTLSAAPATSVSDEMFELPPLLPVYTWSEARALNDRGDIVGVTFNGHDDSLHPTFWPADGGPPRELGYLGPPPDPDYEVVYARPEAINNNGDVVGLIRMPDNIWTAIFWPGDGGPARGLSTLGGWYADASDLNDRGDVVGRAQTPSGAYHATLWPASGGPPRDLGTLGPGYPESVAYAINERGDVVGASYPDGLSRGTRSRATLWPADGGPPQDLGVGGGESSVALGINERGDIVGRGAGGAALWPAGCRLSQPLPYLYGPDGWAQGRSINDRGDVVGVRGSLQHPILWPVDGPPRDLGRPAGNWGEAYAINNSGYSVGWAQIAGSERAVRWSRTATPHPATTVRIYKDHDAWRPCADGGRDEATLRKLGMVKHRDFSVHPISSLASGIPAGTRVVILTANSSGNPATSASQRSSAAQDALVAFLQTGGTLLVDLADTETAEGYRVPGATGTPSFSFPDACGDVTLTPTLFGPDGLRATEDDHRLARGPDDLPGTADDLDDGRVDLANGASDYSDRTASSNVPRGCSAVHGNLEDGITLPSDARVFATASWPDGPKPVLAEYCHAAGRVLVNTLTLGYFGHKPREGSLEPLRSSYVQRSLFAYALSARAPCNLPPDDEAPVLTVPADMTVNATGPFGEFAHASYRPLSEMPGGALVTLVASATDNVGVASLSCTAQPAFTGSATRPIVWSSSKAGPSLTRSSRMPLPIGISTISCTATDGAGNKTSRSFEVSVRGAPTQIARLIEHVQGPKLQIGGPEYPGRLYLVDMLRGAHASAAPVYRASDDGWSYSDAPRACKGLEFFIAELNRGYTSNPVAKDDIAVARRIQKVLRCRGLATGVISNSLTRGLIRDGTLTVSSGPDPGFSRTATTDESSQSWSPSFGRYVFADLAPGSYRITATAPGFITAAKDVQIGTASVDVNIGLQPDPSFTPLVRPGGSGLTTTTGLSMQDNTGVQLEAARAPTVLWSGAAPNPATVSVNTTGLVVVTYGNGDIRSPQEAVVTATGPTGLVGAIRINSYSFDHDPRTITMVWRPVAGATRYDVTIEYCNGTYRDPMSDGTGLRPYDCTSWGRYGTKVATETRYTFNFLERRAGRWRVAARDAAGSVIRTSEYVYLNFVR